jgi:hypothetical protein
MNEYHHNIDGLAGEIDETSAQDIPEPLEYWTLDQFPDIVQAEL